MNRVSYKRRGVLGYRCGASGLALVMAAGFGTAAMAQTATGGISAPAPTATDANSGIEEIVVTAQRREQNVQDVPIAVTALTQQSLAVNRVVSVTDLSLLAPGLSVVPSAGGTQIPSFSMRGLTSYGVVPGSDKAVSIYLDGVYISSTRASIFDLPDINQIEVLRGPQGTLFGRNATAGAVSISTHDPSGRFGFEQDFTAGNLNQFRSRTSISLPAWGKFSAYITYVRNYERGDIRNTGAGTVINFSNSTDPQIPTTRVSPKWLGTTNSNSFFAAVKYEPTDNFKIVNKVDWAHDDGTQSGIGFLGADLSGPAGPTLGFLLATNPVLTAGPQRPSQVNNSLTTPNFQTNWGDSLTATYVGDHITIKNIAAYRFSLIYNTSQLDGLGGLQLPVAPGFSLPFTVLGLTNLARGRQESDELNAVYTSHLLTLTVGALYFHSNDTAGAIPGLQNNVAFTPIIGGVLPKGVSNAYNKATSLAAYAQAEVHLTSKLELVGGIRETHDKKTGSIALSPPLANPDFSYTNTKPSFLGGVNYKPTEDVLLYGKYSTAFVSGGSVAGIPFLPETVSSWEAGLKGEFLDRHLRTNLALYDAVYHHLQDASGGSTYNGPLVQQYPFIPQLGTFVIDQGGSVVAKGVEFEGTAVLGHGASVGSNISYDHTVYRNISPSVDTIAGGVAVPPVPAFLPKWTVGLYGQYDHSLGRGLQATLRIDANWRSTIDMVNPVYAKLIPAYADAVVSPATWLVNARASVSGFKLGRVDGEVALWVKNLTNDGSLTYVLAVPGLVDAGNYQQARTFGVDLHFKF